MGEFVLKDAVVKVGTSAAPTDLSDHVRSVTVNYSAELQDKTAMGDDARSRIAGVKDFNIAIEFNQDYAASKVDAILFPMVGSTAKYITVKATTATVSATNPRFYGMVLLEGYSPVAGAVGDLATVSVTFQGDGDLTRSTTST